MATAFRAATSQTFTGTPASVTVTKPAGTVDGDLITVIGAWRATIASDMTPDPATGWAAVHTDDIGISENRMIVWFRTASSEGASWSFLLSNAIAGIVTAVAWDGAKLSAGTPGTTWAASNATRDSVSPYQAGFIGTQINRTPNSWSVIFSLINDEIGSGSSLSLTTLTNMVLVYGPTTFDIGAQGGTGFYIVRVYEKFDSKWEADAAGVGMSNSAGPASFVNGLWIPNYGLAAVAPDAWAWRG